MIFNNLFAKYLVDNNVISEEQVNSVIKICDDISSPLFIELGRELSRVLYHLGM